MCLVAVKYFKDIGFCGVKNRDRGYVPLVKIVQSNRNGIQRLYIEDGETRYTEGLNEFGVCILSASLAVKSDEKEGDKAGKSSKKKSSFYASPDGKKIRDALYAKTPLEAVKHLIQTKLSGSTLVFNEDECYVLELGKEIEKDGEKLYEFDYKKLDKDQIIVRTNHGIMLPQFGYEKDSDDPHEMRSRKSSEIRRKIALQELEKITDPSEMMDAMSVRRENVRDVAYMNPIRTGDITKKEMVTTGQIMLTPAERTLHYRPIHSDVEFSYTKLNNPQNKTFFEIISNRKLLGFKEFLVNKKEKQ